MSKKGVERVESKRLLSVKAVKAMHATIHWSIVTVVSIEIVVKAFTVTISFLRKGT